MRRGPDLDEAKGVEARSLTGEAARVAPGAAF